MRGRWTAALLAVGLVGAVPNAAVAMTGGSPDTQHAYVVAILSGSATRPSCSGVWTLVGRQRFVITDAHCVSRTNGTAVRVFFGRQWASGAGTYAGRSYRDPSYDASTHRNDVAVVKLTADPRVSPATLAAYDEAPRVARVTTVGFGDPHRGQRRDATEIVTGRSSWRLYLRPGTGNSCDGDSGGPDLVPGTHRVLALTDMGTCSSDEDTRLDVGAARTFLISVR